MTLMWKRESTRAECGTRLAVVPRGSEPTRARRERSTGPELAQKSSRRLRARYRLLPLPRVVSNVARDESGELIRRKNQGDRPVGPTAVAPVLIG